MFKHSAPLPYGVERRGETPAVVALYPTHANRRPAAPIPAPTLTRRMRDHLVRPAVETGIPIVVPAINAVYVGVGTVRQHEEGGNHG